MTIAKSVAAFATLLAIAPFGASAAALYGGTTTASVTAGIDVSTDATGSPSQSSQTGDAVVGVTVGTPVVVSATSDVKSDADLKAYSQSLMQTDANIASADASANGSVTVAYFHPGKLFGIFPVEVKAETTAAVGADGSPSVTTRMPWWNLFVTGTGSTSATVDENLSNSSEITTDLKMETDASAQARLISAIVAAHMSISAEAIQE